MSHKVTTSKFPATALIQPSPAAARKRIKKALLLRPSFISRSSTGQTLRLSFPRPHTSDKQWQRPSREKQTTGSERLDFHVSAEAQRSCFIFASPFSRCGGIPTLGAGSSLNPIKSSFQPRASPAVAPATCDCCLNRGASIC